MDQWSAYSTFILLAGVRIPVKGKKTPPPVPIQNSIDHNENEHVHPLFLGPDIRLVSKGQVLSPGPSW